MAGTSASSRAEVGKFVEIGRRVRLWVDDDEREDKSAILLIMGANTSGLAWPDELVDNLRQRHRVVRYDHRDTGRARAPRGW